MFVWDFGNENLHEIRVGTWPLASFQFRKGTNTSSRMKSIGVKQLEKSRSKTFMLCFEGTEVSAQAVLKSEALLRKPHFWGTQVSGGVLVLVREVSFWVAKAPKAVQRLLHLFINFLQKDRSNIVKGVLLLLALGSIYFVSRGVAQVPGGVFIGVLEGHSFHLSPEGIHLYLEVLVSTFFYGEDWDDTWSPNIWFEVDWS